MSDQLKQLQNLQAQLHEVNLEFARAAQPLDRLADMNGKQREQLADQLRAVWARWKTVTQQISQVLQSDSANECAGGAAQGDARAGSPPSGPRPVPLGKD